MAKHVLSRSWHVAIHALILMITLMVAGCTESRWLEIEKDPGASAPKEFVLDPSEVATACPPLHEAFTHAEKFGGYQIRDPKDVREAIGFLDERFGHREWVGEHVFWNDAPYLMVESMQ